jgi:thiol:disulfide interchange protein DsbD
MLQRPLRYLLALLAALPLAAVAQGLLGQIAPGDDFLPPDEAFQYSAAIVAGDKVALRWVIADGYYLYRHRLQAKTDSTNVTLGVLEAPAGEKKHDEFFGDVEIYHQQLDATVPFTRGGGDSFELKVTYQGCAEKGLCYPPITKAVTLVLPQAGAAPAAAPAAAGMVSEQDRLARLISTGNLFVVMATFFGLGLLLAFTPCVLPMIPILSGIIVGEGKHIGKLRALLLSLAYVLGMAVAYAAAGVAAAWSGTMVASALQNVWVLGAFALVFVVLALSMFGVYELQLPGFLRQPLSSAGHRLPGGKLASVAGMGVLSAIIVSPCVAAPLAGALLYISRTQNVALGGAALFAMALGMGIPLLAVGVSEGALLPKSGPWMVRVKQIFGVLLLAVALWIVWPVLRPSGGSTDFVRVASIADLDAKLKSPGKPVMLDFYADWCVSCKEMEALTFSDARVKQRLDAMLLLQADVTANTAEHKMLLKRFSLFGPPGIIFFDAQGREISGLRVIGYQNADRFLRTLERANAP